MGVNVNDTRNKLKFFPTVKRNLTGLYDRHCPSCSLKAYSTKTSRLHWAPGGMGGETTLSREITCAHTHI